MTQAIGLQGKILIRGRIKALTGLRIGGAAGGMEIGGVDNPVIRDPVTGRPYIPGSSLKGKMRSLLTRALGLPLKELVKGRGRSPSIFIHWCEPDEYFGKNGVPCTLCRTFGTAGERAVEPARAIVRDAFLLDEIEIPDEDGNLVRRPWTEVTTDLPYTEVKWEATIDVVTAAANPRQMERVPPGALFDMEMLLAVYDKYDRQSLETLLLGMRLLEDDYLGSNGTRGYGRIQFRDLSVIWRSVDYYNNPTTHPEQVLVENVPTLHELTQRMEDIVKAIWPKGD